MQKPSKSQAVILGLVAGGGSFIFAASELIDPTTQAPEGRWSLITAPIFYAFGSHGLFIYWAIIGIIITVIALTAGEK